MGAKIKQVTLADIVAQMDDIDKIRNAIDDNKDAIKKLKEAEKSALFALRLLQDEARSGQSSIE